MVKVRSPRAVFVDYPAGLTFGRPDEPDHHERVLTAALSELPRFTRSGQIRNLPYRWELDDNRSWEATLREELLKPPLTGPMLEKIIRVQS